MPLPTAKIAATRKNPKRLVFYGKPKVGKTTLLSRLSDCLILDFEEGSEHVDAMKVHIIGLKPLRKESPEQIKNRQEKKNRWYLSEVIRDINDHRKANDGKFPYKHVAIDTVTKMEDMCVMDATQMYMGTIQGKAYNREGGKVLPRGKWEPVTSLPNGAGYLWLRKSYAMWLDAIDNLAPNVILVAHPKDKYINKLGKETISTDLDLTGKIAGITAAASDAIGYIYRKKDQTLINFASKDETCGSRCSHLKGQEIVLMEEKDGKLVTHWDKIYVE